MNGFHDAVDTKHDDDDEDDDPGGDDGIAGIALHTTHFVAVATGCCRDQIFWSRCRCCLVRSY